MYNWNNLTLPDNNVYFKDDDVVIYCADCREILPLLPNKSIDLVLTDPVYQNLDDYQWLYKISSDKLNDSGQLIAYFADLYLPELMRFDFYGLTWAKLIVERNLGTNHAIWKIHCKAGCKHALWFYKNKLPEDMNWATDFIYSKPDGINVNHKWSKNLPTITELIGRHTQNNNLILDPFNGGGSTTWCAKKLGRKCIGIEISEKYCQIAVERLRQSVMRLE